MLKKLRVKFESKEDVKAFGKLMDLKDFDSGLVASHRFTDGKRTFRNTLNKDYQGTEIFKKKSALVNNYTTWKWREDKPYSFCIFHLTPEKVIEWSDKLEKKINKTRSIWFPLREMRNYRSTTYTTISNSGDNQYPIYIVSKGRWQPQRSKTANYLTKMKIHFNIVVEKEQYDNYLENMDAKYCRVLIIPQKYFDEYETNDPEGDAINKSKGSGCARNFAWNHSKRCGYKKHWVMDDNIHCFYTFYNNRKLRVYDKGWFKMFEDFSDGFENVKMSGPNYVFFCSESQVYAPYVNNTRIYSCNLISNDLPCRWRGRYNEDTLLSLDILSLGYDTLLTNFLIQDKASTMTVKGGNCDEIYKDGTKKKSEIMVREYPKISKLVWKFKRWHHEINYKVFERKEYKYKKQIKGKVKLSAFKIEDDTEVDIDSI
jgi:hypothetical protein